MAPATSWPDAGPMAPSPLTAADRRYALGLTVAAAAIAPVFVAPFARGSVSLDWLLAPLLVAFFTAMPASVLQAAQTRLALALGSVALCAWVTLCWVGVMTSNDAQSALIFVSIPMMGIPFALGVVVLDAIVGAWRTRHERRAAGPRWRPMPPPYH